MKKMFVISFHNLDNCELNYNKNYTIDFSLKYLHSERFSICLIKKTHYYFHQYILEKSLYIRHRIKKRNSGIQSLK